MVKIEFNDLKVCIIIEIKILNLLNRIFYWKTQLPKLNIWSKNQLSESKTQLSEIFDRENSIDSVKF